MRQLALGQELVAMASLAGYEVSTHSIPRHYLVGITPMAV